jgi:hypothetical protein
VQWETFLRGPYEKKSKEVVDEELKGESQVLGFRCRDRRSEKLRW